MFFAGLIPNPHALALDNDIGVSGFEHFMLDQVMPNMGFVVGDNFTQVILQIAVHGTCSFFRCFGMVNFYRLASTPISAEKLCQK
jgi:hypothetical protein